MAGFDPKEYQRLQEKHPNLGPIIGPWVDKFYEPGGLLAESEGARLLREQEQQNERRFIEKARLGNRTGLEERWSKMTAPGAPVLRPAASQEVSAPPPQNLPPPMGFLERMAAQKRYSPSDAREGQAAVRSDAAMKAKGYSPANLDFTAADGSKPANIFYQEKDGKTRYTIPGQQGLGGVPGSAEFQGQRQGGGSFSVIGGRTPEEQAAIDERVASINKQIDAQRIAQGKPTLAEEERLNAMASMVDRFASPPDGMNPQQMELWKVQQAQVANMLTQQAENDKAQQVNAAAQQKAALEQYRWQREQGVREQQAEQTEYDRGVARQQAQKEFELKVATFHSPRVDPARREKMALDEVNRYLVPGLTPGEPPEIDRAAFARNNLIESYNPDQQAESNVPYYRESDGKFIVFGKDGVESKVHPATAFLLRLARG